MMIIKGNKFYENSKLVIRRNPTLKCLHTYL